MKTTMKKNCQRKWLKLTQGIRESAHKTRSPFLLVASMLISLGTHAQPAPQGGFGGPGGPPPGMMGRNQNREVVDQFDADGDGMLNTAERQKAAEFIKANPQGRGGRGGGFGGPGGPGNRGGRRPGRSRARWFRAWCPEPSRFQPGCFHRRCWAGTGRGRC